MYYVYTITLPKGEVYVGCTNFLRRRKDQHNENKRNRHGRFATYIADNYPDLTIALKDLNVIASFANRDEALKYEKKTAKSYIGKSVLLNDNYNVDCSRKGKNIGNTAKKYVLVDIVAHGVVYIFDLMQYCKKNGLEYSLIQRTVRGCKVAYNRYKAFYEFDWLDIEDKEYYLSGQFYADHLEKSRIAHGKKTSKTYLVRTPTGEVETITNLDKYAREHNLTAGTLHSTLTLPKSTKGYKVIKRIGD